MFLKQVLSLDLIYFEERMSVEVTVTANRNLLSGNNCFSPHIKVNSIRNYFFYKIL